MFRPPESVTLSNKRAIRRGTKVNAATMARAVALITHTTTAPATLTHTAAPAAASAPLPSSSPHSFAHPSPQAFAAAATGPAAHTRTTRRPDLTCDGGRRISQACMARHVRLGGDIQLSGFEPLDDISDPARAAEDQCDAGRGERLVGIRTAIAREHELNVLVRHELA